jgi:hypothetical protein
MELGSRAAAAVDVGPVESFQEEEALGTLTVPELDQVSNDMIDRS